VRSRRRWDFADVPPRRAVEGGVVVAAPGKVSDPAAADLVAAAQLETEPHILARGRTYARAGQVVAVHVAPKGFTAQIQGTGARPYEVRLDRITISGSDRVAADCTCPYGCDHDWCKHAAALAYVAAFLLDRDPIARATWAGEAAIDASTGAVEPPDAQQPVPPGIPGSIADTAVVRAAELMLPAEDLATLRTPPPRVDVAQLLAAAEALVPHPWLPVEMPD
jgi:hypothetical protein